MQSPPNRTVVLRNPHEGSKFRPGTDKDDVRSLWKDVKQLSAQLTAMGHTSQAQSRNFERMRRRILGGSGSPVQTGWAWASPIELPVAPYPAYPEGNIINIQATHAIVTTGIRDAADPTGPLIKSKAGLWVAMQDVPAQSTVSGNAVYNLPQFPLPTPDDYDDDTNFWYFLGKTFC